MGRVRAATTTTPTATAVHGRRATASLQRAEAVTRPVAASRPAPGMRRRSTRWPSIASRAGSSVTAAIITTRTVRLVERATPLR